ncbi:transposase [Thermospira aquatica]|uniref:Transposase n=1 Tax=Thermospira aquatica TaxID=2828656 RepID=A0AAX3BGV5_9SPIR|nr:transposase [Thermospira aquatica]
MNQGYVDIRNVNKEDSRSFKELYEIKISYANISRISQVGIEEIQKWRSRPLMEEYAVVFLDAMVFPIKR